MSSKTSPSISALAIACLGSVFFCQSPALAQGSRLESEAARTVLPARPPSPAAAARAKGVTPTPSTQAITPPPVSAADVSDPNRTGLMGVVLGMRIDSTLSFLGINRCAPRIKQVMLALSDNRPSAYFFEPTARNANQSPTLITLESLNGENQTDGSRYSILTVNPDCSGFYTQSVTWPLPCEEVARTSFPNFRFDRRIVANVDSYRASTMLQMSTMKTPGGCVTVKKEIFR